MTRLTLNRPAKLNALNTALADQLLAAISVATSDGTRLVVVEGAGRGFSGGFDFGNLDQESGGDLALRLVIRFRSSHHFAAPLFANFGIEGH